MSRNNFKEEYRNEDHPTLEECKIIAAEGSYGVIPISTEMYADMTTPIEVLRILKKVSGHVYLPEKRGGG